MATNDQDMDRENDSGFKEETPLEEDRRDDL